MMQLCWKGSVGAVDKASNREDSNTNNHLPQDPFSTVQNSDCGCGWTIVLQNPLLRMSITSRGVLCSLFAAAVVCFYIAINGNTELEHIVRMRLECLRFTGCYIRKNSLGEREKGSVRLPGCGQTATTSSKEGPESTLQPQPLTMWFKFPRSMLPLSWWKFMDCLGCDRKQH